MEARAELNQRRYASAHVHVAGGRRHDAGDELQAGALAAAVSPNDPDSLASIHAERDFAQRIEGAGQPRPWNMAGGTREECDPHGLKRLLTSRNSIALSLDSVGKPGSVFLKM